MMYSNKFVSTIKVNGKVLREDNGIVTIPFGSEYSVLLKNLNSVRAMAKVSIDGQDATEDTWLVLQPNSNIELERFIRSGNLQSGNRFKFIERTKQVEDHRGIGAEDGLVRIEYKFERRVEEVPIYKYTDYQEFWPKPRWFCYDTVTSGGLFSKTTATGNTAGAQIFSINNCNNSGWELERSVSDVGITVPGSHSEQKFQSVSGFETEISNVLVLRLRGVSNGQQVDKPVTVYNKPKCITCGRTNKATAKFCNQCGTSLVLF